ncbi:12896_t:CDS:2 [Entrophospora sp. SA101]|nr:12896_t:CDS:2 [Entrophospora sp. SA101]
MKLIYIKSTITPKDYNSLEQYLSKENINYEVYRSVKTNQKEKLKEQLIAGYKASAQSKKLAREDEI